MIFKKMIISVFLVLTLLLVVDSVEAQSVEVAPRITDREIVRNLADIKSEQKVVIGRMDASAKQVDQSFEQVDQRFDDMLGSMNSRFEQSDQRFDDILGSMNSRLAQIDQRLVNLENNMRTMFGSIIAMIIALFGYIIWDRRTAMRPLEQKVNALEEDLVRDMDIRNPAGSSLTRVIEAFRDLAKSDDKVAEILRSHSLL
jgi:predicted PurR-regulated permease PerM